MGWKLTEENKQNGEKSICKIWPKRSNLNGSWAIKVQFEWRPCWKPMKAGVEETCRDSRAQRAPWTIELALSLAKWENSPQTLGTKSPWGSWGLLTIVQQRSKVLGLFFFLSWNKFSLSCSLTPCLSNLPVSGARTVCGACHRALL